MPTSSSSSLFNLIKSLTRAEKGYFKKFASINSPKEENNYLRLFELLDKQLLYNEEEVLRKGKFNDGHKSNQLPNLKNYLYNLIQKSLRSFHAAQDSDTELRAALHSIRIFYEKGLFFECDKLLLKAKSLARTHEKLELLLELLGWEKKILINSPHIKSDIFSERSTALHLVYDEVLKQLENRNNYARLLTEMTAMYRKMGSTCTAEQLLSLKKMLEHPLLQNESLATSNEARQSFNTIFALYHGLTDEKDEALYYCEKRVRLIELSPEQIELYPGEYIAALINLVNSSIACERYEDVPVVLDKLSALPARLGNRLSESIKADLFFRIYYIRSRFYYATREFEKAVAMAPDIEKGMPQFRDKLFIPMGLVLYYNMAYHFFVVGNYNKALRWNNRVINCDNGFAIRPDVYCFAAIFNIIIHYELGNYDLLEHLLRSVQLYLKKKNRLFKFEVSFFGFFQQKLLSANTAAERKTVFISWKKEFEELMNEPQEGKTSTAFDYIAWIDSKITGKSMLQLLRKN